MKSVSVVTKSMVGVGMDQMLEPVREVIVMKQKMTLL